MINIILRILLAAIIGYCTNYVAIKMLFRPKKEITIAGFRVPFTPGIIPKNKNRIAKAVGNAVSDRLLTGDDLINELSSDKFKNAISSGILNNIYGNQLSLRSNIEKIIGTNKYTKLSDKLEDILYIKIKENLDSLDINAILQKEVIPAIKEKLKNNMMLAMFVNDSLIQSFIAPIEDAIKGYIDTHAEVIIRPVIKNEINKISTKSYSDIISDIAVENDVMQHIIEIMYQKVVLNKGSDILRKLNIAALVEKKINEMDVSEVEDLVMSVMKNELQAVVNLGALIGAVIGVLNIFI